MEKLKKKTKKAAEKKKRKWYEAKVNSSVYVKGQFVPLSKKTKPDKNC